MFTRKFLKALTEGKLWLAVIGTLHTMWLLLLFAQQFLLRSSVSITTASARGRTCLVICWNTRILW